MFAAILLRLPLRQYTAMVLSLGSVDNAFVLKSDCNTLIFNAFWICPSAYSSAVRTSRRTIEVSAIHFSNSSTDIDLNLLFCAWHPKMLHNKVKKLIIINFCIIMLVTY